jgi:hypothetical protein
MHKDLVTSERGGPWLLLPVGILSVKLGGGGHAWEREKKIKELGEEESNEEGNQKGKEGESVDGKKVKIKKRRKQRQKKEFDILKVIKDKQKCCQ